MARRRTSSGPSAGTARCGCSRSAPKRCGASGRVPASSPRAGARSGHVLARLSGGRVATAGPGHRELVKSADFAYHRPGDIAEAVRHLQDYGGGARILAGGQSLMPMMNMRLWRPDAVVDINGLTDLAALTVRRRRDADRRARALQHARILAARRGTAAAAQGDGGLRRRPPGAQSRHHRRQPGAGRPDGRNAARLPGARRDGHRPRALRRAHHRDGRPLRRRLRRHPRARRGADRGPRAPASAALRLSRVLPPAQRFLRALGGGDRPSRRTTAAGAGFASGSAGSTTRPSLPRPAWRCWKEAASTMPTSQRQAKPRASAIDPPDDIRGSAEYRAHLVPIYVARVLRDLRASARV